MGPFARSVCIVVVITCYAVARMNAHTAAFSANLYSRPSESHALFDITTINRGNHLNETTFTLTVPADDVYLGMLSAGVLEGNELNIEYNSQFSKRFTCYRQPQNQTGHDTYGRDHLIWLRAGKVLNVLNKEITYSTPTGLLTSWGTASLTFGGGVTVAFSVARTTNFSAGPVSFPFTYLNLGSGWDANSDQFIAPRGGIYFFCFATRVARGVRADFDLLVNDQETVDIYRMSTAHVADDTLSRSVVLRLSGGDRVAIASGYPGVTNANNHTTLSGFLYEQPAHQRYAWGVYRSSPWSYADDRVTYNVVLVNEGSVWNVNNFVHCPISGVYYVYVSAGLYANDGAELTIMRNTTPMGSLSRNDITHNGIDTFGRSMLIECSVDDILWISASPGTELYSSSSLQTSFIGFYLYP